MASPTVPMLPPPEGVTPDFESRNADFTIVFGVTFSLATFFMILRLYTAAYILRRLGFDEGGLISGALVSLIEKSASNILMLRQYLFC